MSAPPAGPRAPRFMPCRQQAKLCPRCGVEQAAAAFYRTTWRDRRSPDVVMRERLSPYCRDCTRRTVQEYHSTPRGRAVMRQAQRRYRRRHRARLAAYYAAWVRRNRDKRAASNRRYSAAHRPPPPRIIATVTTRALDRRSES